MSAFGEEEKKREMIIAWLEVISISGKLASFKVPAQLSHHLQYGKVGRILFHTASNDGWGWGLRMELVGINTLMLGVII